MLARLGWRDVVGTVEGMRSLGVAKENVSGRPRFSGGSLPFDNGLVGIDTAGTSAIGFILGLPGGLLDRSTRPPCGGGGGGPEEDAATDISAGFLLRASANCALEIASFSVSIPTSTPLRFAASMS